jgi:AbrB family looped-hinge helix DNA binding protein
MKVTSKGQVTIPQAIREQLAIFPNSEVNFVKRGAKVYLEKAKGSARGTALVETLRGRGRKGLSTDDIMALTRGN